MTTQAQIFLSYAREDIDTAKKFYKELSAAGFRPWMDKVDLLPGQRWQQEIPKALRASDFVLILFSRNSIAKRGFIQREFKLALDTLEEIPEGVIHTIPVRLDECDVPEQFSELHYADFFEEDGLRRIVQALRVELEQRRKLSNNPESTKEFSGELEVGDGELYHSGNKERIVTSREPLLWKNVTIFASIIVIVAAIILFAYQRDTHSPSSDSQQQAKGSLHDPDSDSKQREEQRKRTEMIEVTRLGAQLKQQLAVKRLTTPEEDNALDTIRKLGRFASGQEEATLGRKKIVEQYLQLAETEEQGKDWAMALTYLERARDINPDDKAIKIARERIEKKKADTPGASPIGSDQPVMGRKKLVASVRLLSAAESGNIDKVKSQLAAHADLNIRDSEDNTALMLAASGGFTEVVKVLLAHKADFTVKNKSGDTALSLALLRLHPDTARELLFAGAFDEADREDLHELKQKIRPAQLEEGRRIMNMNADERDRRKKEETLRKMQTLMHHLALTIQEGIPFRPGYLAQLARGR